MAKLWIVYREALRLLGAPLKDIPLDTAIARLDIAPWRLFTGTTPDAVPTEQVDLTTERKRALLEVREEDRYDLCGLSIGFYESPYSPQECLRRLSR
jgi:hypothetical protein